jgi:hypothetical protein
LENREERPVKTGRFHFTEERTAPPKGSGQAECGPYKLGEFEVGRIGVRLGDDFATLAEILEVKEHGAAEVLLDFATGAAVSHAAWKIGGIGHISGASFLNHNEIFLHDAGGASESGAKVR